MDMHVQKFLSTSDKNRQELIQTPNCIDMFVLWFENGTDK